jgi:hypothetical protein
MESEVEAVPGGITVSGDGYVYSKPHPVQKDCHAPADLRAQNIFCAPSCQKQAWCPSESRILTTICKCASLLVQPGRNAKRERRIAP